MRLPMLTAGLFLAFSTIVTAASYDTPEAMLQAFYAPYLANDTTATDDGFRSKALNGLYAADAEASDGEVGALDFDPYINGQDWMLTDFQIGQAEITGDTAKVAVTFKNFDQDTRLVYDLVDEDGWKIDNVTSSEGDVQYSLVDIFNSAGYGGQ